jgi:KaiC/GvpD/RAD55 family RecA-like ATPase
MFRDTIDGINNLFETDIYPGAIVLIMGPPGSLKSGFTFNVLSKYLEHRDEFGIYVTLEESTESHLRNMQSMGISIPDNLLISDYTDIRRRFEKGKEHPDFLEMIAGVIKYFKNKEGDKFTCFALDALGVLYTFIGTEDLRTKLFNFFKILRQNRLTSLLIMETPLLSNIGSFAGSEGYLCDGIIEMGTVETKQDVMLYAQVRKMRATPHSRKKYLIEVGKNGISILDPVPE